MLAAAVPDAPPVLLEPAKARSVAHEATASHPLWAAEVLLLAGDPAGARAVLDRAPPSDSPRRLRLEADIGVALEDRRAEPVLAALGRHPGWEQHAARQSGRLDDARTAENVVRLGTLLFAGCLGLLVLGGARELLRISRDTLLAGAALAVGLLVLASVSKPLMTVIGVVGVGGLALVHAGVSTVRRTAAAPRARTMIAVMMLLGFLGALFAVGTQLGVARLLALVG